MADGLNFSANTAANDQILTYLNAYNAPHWMNIGSQMQQQGGVAQNNFSIPNWNNRHTANTGGSVERYGTSWMRDLLRASSSAPQALQTTGAKWFNGAVDANHGYSPKGHSSHDVGMALDLGTSNYISKTRPGGAPDSNTGNQFNNAELVGVTELPTAQRSWSIQSAITQATANGLPQSAAYTSNGVNLGFNRQQSALKDFLSMYAVVRDDAAQGTVVAGSRGSLAITNSTVTRNGQSVDVSSDVRTALFGNGTATNALIRRVLIGGRGVQNPLTNIRNSLTNLGITNGTSSGHQNHFHIYLRPPTAMGIAVGARNLEASANFQTATIETDTYSVREREVTTSQYTENLMIDAFINTSLADFDRPAIVSVVTAASQPVKEITYCRDIMLSVDEGRNNIALFNHPILKSISKDQKTATVTLIQSPKFGGIYFIPDVFKKNDSYLPLNQQRREVSIDRSSWHYDTNLQRTDKDRAVFEIEAGSKKYRLTVNFWIAGIAEENIDNHTECKKLKMHLPDKKLSGSIQQWHDSADISAYISAASQVTYTFVSLLTLIASAQQTLVGFTDLPATALGQTVGEGAAASITLDQNAAGHGWYVDPTPLDNSDDYLPTSNSAVWQAKAGTDAAGKMDMLSVLLHEYGHALGLEHSAEAGDFMNASLQPGMRKLPTAEQLELMSQLVAQLKAGHADASAATDAADHAGHDHDDGKANAPLNLSGWAPHPVPKTACRVCSATGFMAKAAGEHHAFTMKIIALNVDNTPAT